MASLKNDVEKAGFILVEDEDKLPWTTWYEIEAPAGRRFAEGPHALVMERAKDVRAFLKSPSPTVLCPKDCEWCYE